MSAAETKPAGVVSIWHILAVAVALSFSAPFARAQIAPVPPAPVAPSPSILGREVMQQETPTQPRPRADIEVPPAGGFQVPADLANREVQFDHITVEGATAFGPGDFAPLFAPLLRRRVRFADWGAAINKITVLYENGGYVFYSVALPKQDFDGRELRVVVLEGSVADIEVAPEIQSEAVRQRIADLLGKLRGKRPLKRSELERQLLLAADTPGVALRASAKPGPGLDKVTLVVGGTFERWTPIAQIDSFSTVPDTSMNFRVGGIGRSLLLGGDQLEARYLFAVPWNRLQLFDLRYSFPVGLDGGRFSLQGQAVWQRPPAFFNGQPVDYMARSILGRAQYAHPIVRSLDWTLVALGMIDVIDVDYSIIGVGVPGDSLRVMRGGLATSYKDGWKGLWTANVLASVGLDTAGAEANNRFSAGPSFFKANLSLQRVQPIGQDFTFVAKAIAQVSGGTVPAAEVFAYGGRDYGRAFNVGESFGDRGAAVSAELRYALNWFDFLKDRADPHVYVFADHGWISSADPRNAPYFYEATSAGGGIRVLGFKKYTAELEFAKALDAPPVDVGSRPWRVSVRVGTQF